MLDRLWAYLVFVFTEVREFPARKHEPTRAERASFVEGALSHFGNIVGYNWADMTRSQTVQIHKTLKALTAEIEHRWAYEKRTGLRRFLSEMDEKGVTIEDLQAAMPKPVPPPAPEPVPVVDNIRRGDE